MVINTLSSGLTPRGLGTRLLVSSAGENLILIWPANGRNAILGEHTIDTMGNIVSMSILRGLGSNTYRGTVYILIHATQV